MEECGSKVEYKFLSKLSDEIFFEILIRLPSKSACRFKVVCKHWLSLISSNYFTSHYMSYRCQDTHENFTLVFTRIIERHNPGLPREILRQEITGISNNSVVSKLLKRKSLDRSLQRRFKHNFKRRNIPLASENLKIRPEASCDDLLLCSDSLVFYSVINLVTREYAILSHMPLRVRNNKLSHVPGLLRYPDAKNISNEDGLCRFKVILVPFVEASLDPWYESSRFNVDVYCSEMRQWSVVNVDWYPLKFDSFRTPIIAHDGMLHWLNGRSLVSVDPFCDGDVQLKLCHDIILPKASRKYRWLLLGVSGGLIRIVGRYYEDWQMKELHVWDLEGCESKSWRLAHKVPLHKSSLIGMYLSYLAVHPYDTDLIFLTKGNMIYLFNLRTDLLKEYREVKLWDNSNGSLACCLDRKASVLLHRWFPSPVPQHYRGRL